MKASSMRNELSVIPNGDTGGACAAAGDAVLASKAATAHSLDLEALDEEHRDHADDHGLGRNMRSSIRRPFYCWPLLRKAKRPAVRLVFCRIQAAICGPVSY